MKILITGAKGQLGTDLNRVLRDRYDVMAIGREKLDITDAINVDAVVKKNMPDVIINSAAYTKVDDCETEKELAWKVNVTGPQNLAESAEKYGSSLVHISTDYVFDGRKKVPEPYTETDQTSPISNYGKSKLEGEKAIQKLTSRFTIFRTAWLYGINGPNFLKTMLKLSLRNSDNKIKVVNDQFGSPTWTYRLALQIERIVETDERGIFHATAQGYCTWYELAVYFLKKMDVFHTLIPCTTEEYPTPTARPTNSILENRNLKNKGMDIMADWKSDVDKFVLNFREVLLKEMEKEA